MTNRFARKLSYGKKLLLASAAILVIAGPIVVGLMNPPRSRAQAQIAAATAPTFEVASVKPASPPDTRMREMERLQLALSAEGAAPTLADGGVPVPDIAAVYPEADWDAVCGEMFLES